MTPSHAVGENSTIAGDAAKDTNHRSPRPRSAAQAMAGLLARGLTTDADLPSFPVITSGVVSPLTVAGAATASAFRPAPCSLLIPEGNHQDHSYQIRMPAAIALGNGSNPRPQLWRPPSRSSMSGLRRSLAFPRGRLEGGNPPKAADAIGEAIGCRVADHECVLRRRWRNAARRNSNNLLPLKI